MVAADGTTVVRFKKIDLTPLYCYCVPPAPGGGGTGGKLSSVYGPDDQTLRVYPNPVTESEIYVEHLVLSGVESKATVSDVSGRTILQTHIVPDAAGKARIVLDNRLPSGLYFLRLQTGDGLSWDNKFIVSKN